ncbi:regulator of G protein signaling superfamily [Xylariaceae sp. FL0255]|nr:regulator of G protein signaling superfamily [Xylariaceae sp. FL0255]
MGKYSSRRYSPVYLAPSLRELTPPLSDTEDWDTETAMDASRPTSWAIPRTGSPFLNPPTLEDILRDTAPQPWTLGAFMAYLSQNHCLETLEFILDAERYRAAYNQVVQGLAYFGMDHMPTLWEKIMEAYIVPGAPREVNIPSPVRHHLLQLAYTTSPPINPAELDEAVHIIRELMTDSVLVPFLESVAPVAVSVGARDEVIRSERTRLRIPRENSETSDDSITSPIEKILPMFGKVRTAASRSNSSSSDGMEVEMTDDSASPGSSPAGEPMTPPTTPPTSDYSFSVSPKSGNRWRKVGAKLGLGKRSKSRTHTSSAIPPSSYPGYSSRDSL